MPGPPHENVDAMKVIGAHAGRKSGPGKWPCDERKDGIVMQLEAKGARALFFTEITKQGGGYAVGETHQLDAEEFALFPRLF